MIPDPVRQWWRENWAKFKKTENETLGNGDVSGTVEMMGWGVETAQEHHDEEASMSPRAPPFADVIQIRTHPFWLPAA